MNHSLFLNFLPIVSELPIVSLYQKSVVPAHEKDKDDYRIYLPDGAPADVSLFPKADYVEKTFQLGPNFTYLTLYYVGKSLSQNAEAIFGEKVATRFESLEVYSDICVCTEKLKHGRRIIRIHPKYFGEKAKFGIILKEEYWKNPGVAFGKATMTEDGTFDQNGNPNVGYHQQAWLRMGKFVASPEMQGLLSQLMSPFDPTVSFNFSRVFEPANFKAFGSREFQVGGDEYSKNVLSGISRYGPLKTVRQPIKLLFIAREQERVLARTLYTGLISGNEKTKPRDLLRFQMEIHPKKFIPLSGFDAAGFAELESTLGQLSEQDRENTIAVCLLPDTDSIAYHKIKAVIMRHGIHSQCCTKMLIASPYSFQWALANIALGIFAKAGGIPWRVKPHKSNSTIIGIGQSLERGPIDLVTKRQIIVRHRSFSVLTDSTGEFRKLDDLASGASDEDESYISDFASRLRQVLINEDAASDKADLVVIHTPFTLRHKLTNALEGVVRDLATSENRIFVVVKFNSTAEHWFGFSNENNKIPLEGTYCRVNPGEFLIWFEGADRFTKQAKRRCGPPSILKIIGKLPDESVIERVLQDAYDLAGANWRGFNARGLPVSMYYCKLISNFLKGFHEAGEEPPKLENLNPWFL